MKILILISSKQLKLYCIEKSRNIGRSVSLFLIGHPSAVRHLDENWELIFNEVLACRKDKGQSEISGLNYRKAEISVNHILNKYSRTDIVNITFLGFDAITVGKLRKRFNLSPPYEENIILFRDKLWMNERVARQTCEFPVILFLIKNAPRLTGIVICFQSPYSESRTCNGINKTSDVLIVGSRFTAVDAVVALFTEGRQVRVFLSFRSGMLPAVTIIGKVCEVFKSLAVLSLAQFDIFYV